MAILKEEVIQLVRGDVKKIELVCKLQRLMQRIKASLSEPKGTRAQRPQVAEKL